MGTFVKVEQELGMSKSHVYEIVATGDHIGNSPFNGHYVTYLKQKSGQWKIFDDERSQSCTFKKANSRNNYLLLFKQTSLISETVSNEYFEENTLALDCKAGQDKDNEKISNETIQSSEYFECGSDDIDSMIHNLKSIKPSKRTPSEKKLLERLR